MGRETIKQWCLNETLNIKGFDQTAKYILVFHFNTLRQMYKDQEKEGKKFGEKIGFT